MTYADEALEAARAGTDRLREAAFAAQPPQALAPPVDGTQTREKFVAAMDDDLNTPQALAALFELARDINRGRDRGRDILDAQATLRELAGVLGLTLEARTQVPTDRAPFLELMTAVRGSVTVPAEGPDAGDVIDALVEMRREYRAAKQWELADKVRNGLAALGVELKDGPQGTAWSVK